MVAGESPDWLPPGWTVQVKVNNGRTIKFYIDPASGSKFYSKPQVSRYLETVNSGMVGQKKIRMDSVSNHNIDNIGSSPGGKSCSKPDISQYCKTIKSKSCISKEKEVGIGKRSINNGVVERGSPDELPPEWIKEIKTRKSLNGIKKYPYYTDPSSGYVFSSKKDALRYLETGDIDKCAIRPKKRDMNDLELLNGNISLDVKSKEYPEWLPHGWITCYIDPASGRKFYSKLEVSQYLETENRGTAGQKNIGICSVSNNNTDRLTRGKSSLKPDKLQSCKPIEGESCISKQKKVGLGKHAMSNAVIERGSKGDLQPGWIKGTKTRKSVNGIEKDPIDVKTNEFPEWLPNGWLMELKTKSSGSGKKYKCYIDPASGRKFYSKQQVSQYLETVNNSMVGEKNIGIGSASNSNIGRLTRSKSSSKPDTPQNRKPIESESCISIQKKIGIDKQPINNVVIERAPDELPPGWIKEIRTRKTGDVIKKDPYYTDPLSGYIFRSKKDALLYLETGDIYRCAIRPKKRDVNDLELIIGNSSSPSVVDAKKLRYHTTRRQLFAGIERCGTSTSVAPEVESSKERQDIGASAAAKENSASKTSGSKRKRGMEVSVESRSISTPATDIFQTEKLSDNGMFKRSIRKTQIDLIKSKNKRALNLPGQSSKGLAGLKPKNANEKCSGTKENSDPKTKASKRKRGMEVSAENGSVSTPATDILQQEKLLETGVVVKHSNRKTQIDLSKSKNKGGLSLPDRSSKRLAGLKPEMTANSGSSEGALQAAARKEGGNVEANPHLNLAMDAVAHRAPQQLEAEPEREIEPHASVSKEITSAIELSKQHENPLEDQAIPEEQPERQEAEQSKNPPGYQTVSEEQPELQEAKHQTVSEEQPERQEAEKPESQDSQLFYPYMDSWSDPCLEFAFKTLTGAIPVEDNVAIQEGPYPPQVDPSHSHQDVSHSHQDGCLPLPDSGLPNYFQNDVSFHFDALEKPLPVQPLPVNPTYLHEGNVNLPSCSSISPQQTNLEAGEKEDQTKVK